MQSYLRSICVLWITQVLIHSLSRACCERTSRSLDKKWESQRQPFLVKRALELTQKQMLNVLGLSDLPRPTRKVRRPHVFMLDLYKTLSRKARRKPTKLATQAIVNTVRGVVDQERYDRSIPHLHHQLYVFNFSSIPNTEKLISAELRILKKPQGTEKQYIAQHGTTFKAVLYMKSTPFRANQIPYESSRLEALDSFSFDITDHEERWNVFTVTKAVEQWQKSAKKIHFLQLTVESVLSGKLVNPAKLGFTKERRLHSDRALLVIFSDDGRIKPIEKDHIEDTDIKGAIEDGARVDGYGNGHSRAKRAANSANIAKVLRNLNRGSRSRRRRKKSYCRRKPMYVDFRQLNWADWVIAPQGYNAYLCTGDCNFPIDKHLRPTNHATVQTILHTVDPLLAPKACCTPHKLSPISILYTDPGETVVYKKYEDMVVERCGCS